MLITMCFASLLVMYLYVPEIILHPNQYQAILSGDGLKNYYTFAYHIKHGSGIWFDGLLFPYGEHSSFTDNQPGLAVPLAWIESQL